MKPCDHCGKEFMPRRTWQRFCSKKCCSKWFNEERKRALKKLRSDELSVLPDLQDDLEGRN